MLNEVAKKLQEKGYNVEETHVIKNGVIKNGIAVGDGKIRPTFYNSPLFEGMSTDEMVEMIEKVVAEKPGIEGLPENISIISNPDYLLRNSFISVQKKSDEKLFKREFLDLEIYVRCLVGKDGTYKVPMQLGETVPGLMEAAIENTRRNLLVRPMAHVIEKLRTEADIDADFDLHFDEEEEMFVGNTNSNVYGASIICFNEVFRTICQKKNVKGCYIIPSSIHEVLIITIPDAKPEELNEMVKLVNATEVSPEEVLSDHCYHYSLDDDKITF